MKYTELDRFIERNNLLKNVQAAPGIYAILVDNQIAYIGQSKDMRVRCGQHIYNTENAMLVKEQKYLLLLAAKLGGHAVDCTTLECCDTDILTERENYWIERIEPCLNIMTPGGKKDISNLKIEDLIHDINVRRENTLKELEQEVSHETI